MKNGSNQKKKDNPCIMTGFTVQEITSAANFSNTLVSLYLWRLWLKTSHQHMPETIDDMQICVCYSHYECCYCYKYRHCVADGMTIYLN